MSSTNLFGENRTRLGYEDQEWSVWISGMDDIHDKDSLSDALELANELNATFAQLRLNATNEVDPAVMYAVVLHHGYAWTVDTEHAHGLDCGVRACGACSFKRAFPEREAS